MLDFLSDRNYILDTKAIERRARNMKPIVGHFSNTTVEYRRIEDLKDLLASIDENGERYPGERRNVQARLDKIVKAA